MIQGALREIHSDTANSSSTGFNFALPPGKYQFLLFRFEGTADTGQTFDPSDVGTLRIDDGRPLIFTSWDFLDDLAQAKYGIFERTAAAGAAFDWFIPVPLTWFTDDTSIYRVANNDNVRVQINLGSNFATMIGTNTMTMTVFGVEHSGVQPYRLKIIQQDLDIINGSMRHPLREENVLAVYMENNTNITRVRYFQDGQLVYDAARDAIISLHHMDNALETFSATFPFIELNFNRLQNINFVLNDNNELEIQGSASDTVTVHIFAIDFLNSEDFQVTQDEFQTEVGAVLNRKVANRKTRPVELLGQL